jgi:hypothetical protein
MRIKFIALLSSIFFLSIFNGEAQVSFYDPLTIQKIEINFSQPDWDYQLDTAKEGNDGYVVAQWIKINNVQFDSVGVKYKGNSSYDSTYLKNPLHIELDNIIDQSYQGYKDIKLSNGYADPSFIREVLAYDILEKYMDCPQSNFAQLYINGSYIGLFSNTESINKKFCSDHFYSSQNTFFKCNPVVIPGPTTKANLKHIPGADSSGYMNFYELKSDYGWNEMPGLCDTVTNIQTSISEAIDMDRVIWMLAFNSMLVNLDSYTGVFAQNYYIYRDNTGRFNPVMWDLNMSFGGFPFVGSGSSSLAGLTVTDMQQLSPSFHSTDPYWPLINAVFNNPSYKKMYYAHLRTILSENFLNNDYFFRATQLRSVADTAIASDANGFFSYNQYLNSLNTDNTVGSYTVPGLQNLMSARTTYMQSDPDISYSPPVITSVAVDNPSPALTTVVNFSATVTNTTDVQFGYRGGNAERFTKIVMYDDGAHNDGAAGDNTYGCAVAINTSQTQYYVYAENNDAASFSPERAEHEFYVLQAAVAVPSTGQVVINEFLASNTAGETNESGAYADWIELYNNTNAPLSLFGLYLTDDYSAPSKYTIPQGTVIAPNGYMILWADENNNTPSYLHCNFKLAASGESLMLSDGNGNVIDSLTFGQQSADVSYGRCPNGFGPQDYLSFTSFNAVNCSQTIVAEATGNNFIIYPNPASEQFYFNTSISELITIRISNMLGELVAVENIKGGQTFNVTNLPDGIYTVSVESLDSNFNRKLIVAH